MHSCNYSCVDSSCWNLREDEYFIEICKNKGRAVMNLILIDSRIDSLFLKLVDILTVFFGLSLLYLILLCSIDILYWLLCHFAHQLNNFIPTKPHFLWYQHFIEHYAYYQKNNFYQFPQYFYLVYHYDGQASEHL